ncbi:NUDIX domain-containing protein [Schaalia georgiae]|uniref:NUDIX domain-containing protein n=1 Tax=Schaalia georgiae TaxID=52768 RepID=UPI00041CCB0B|nr:NUDIX domain-containing protein [Schaalia georgiae]
MTPRPVVAAAIVDSLHAPTRLLCATRAYPPQLRGRYELPGGKLEPDEAPLEGLAREIREELSTEIRVGEQVRAPSSGDGDASPGPSWWPILEGRVMGVWLAEVAPGSPAPTASGSHCSLEWVRLDQVEALDWIGHDLDVVRAVVEVCLHEAGVATPGRGKRAGAPAHEAGGAPPLATDGPGLSE